MAPATNHLGPVAPATNHLGPVAPAIRSVRSLEGGSSVDFDGLVTPLPEGARPRRVSFWVRAAHQANIGYFTLGGASTQSSVIFFHLKVCHPTASRNSTLRPPPPSRSLPPPPSRSLPPRHSLARHPIRNVAHHPIPTLPRHPMFNTPLSPSPTDAPPSRSFPLSFLPPQPSPLGSLVVQPDGTAGLRSSSGEWVSGAYSPLQWLHVRIDIEWPYRRAHLWLDGAPVANPVAFASDDALDADSIHLFNVDQGVVWWDDVVISL